MSRYRLLAFVLCSSLLLSACYTSGTKFEQKGAAWLQPGITPLADAKVYLEGEPDQVFYRPDGSTLQIWRHRRAWLPDAVYLNREIWLEFNGAGILQAIVNEQNIPKKKDTENETISPTLVPTVTPKRNQTAPNLIIDEPESYGVDFNDSNTIVIPGTGEKAAPN